MNIISSNIIVNAVTIAMIIGVVRLISVRVEHKVTIDGLVTLYSIVRRS